MQVIRHRAAAPAWRAGAGPLRTPGPGRREAVESDVAGLGARGQALAITRDARDGGLCLRRGHALARVVGWMSSCAVRRWFASRRPRSWRAEGWAGAWFSGVRPS